MSDKLPDDVEEALHNCDIYGDDEYGVQTPRASLRLSIAKAIRDAEERMRDACVGLLTRMNSEHATFTPAEAFAIGRFKHAIFAIRSLPLENA